MKKAHKKVSRKVKGSRRKSKAVSRLAKIYRKLSRRRDDFQHKVSKRLIDESQAVIAESLKVKNMMHNRKLARAIADAGWGRFLSKLKYKAERKGGKKRKALHTDGYLFPVLEDLPAMPIQV